MITLINNWNGNIPLEVIPTQFHTDKEVLRTVAPTLGLTALLRHLGSLGKAGLLDLDTEREFTDMVADRLSNKDTIHKSRIHPIEVLIAMKTYSQGKGFRGSNEWPVSGYITAALEYMFYASFANIEPTGKKFLIGLDLSGSMGCEIMGKPLPACEAATAVGMSILRSEPECRIIGFSHEFRDLGITKDMPLKEAISRANEGNWGGTDCALPMIYALNNGLDVDVFVVITDNETWYGNIHPKTALEKYNKKTGKDAKLIVLACTATEFSIADPNSKDMLDIAGFDSSVMAIMKEFIEGNI
jgi:60 kDa SS-A/Ro ribonucleoprotein